MTPTVATARDRVIDMRRRYRTGEVTYEQLTAAADEYIATCEQRAREVGMAFRKPSRSYVLRAL